MGFFFQVIKLPKVITLTIAIFINMFTHLKYMAMGALAHLGLYKPTPEEEEEDSRNDSDNYIVIFDGSSPSFVPIHVVTANIKKRVPIVSYGDVNLENEVKELKPYCTICLEGMELSHQVRELIKCSHVYHRECLDTWVDAGHFTCPLCRSMLLPPKEIVGRFKVD